MAKLVEILARELKEWPEGAESIWQADNGAVLADTVALFTASEISDVDDYVTRAQWEAERARIATNQKATLEARDIAQGGGRFATADAFLESLERDAKKVAPPQSISPFWNQAALAAFAGYCARPGMDAECAAEEAMFAADAFMNAMEKHLSSN